MKYEDLPFGDELEEQLRSFFRSELPQRFESPVGKERDESLVASPTPAARQGQNGFRARLALALSIGVLVLGAFLFSGSTPSDRSSVDLTGNGDSASGLNKETYPGQPPKFKMTEGLIQGKGETELRFVIEPEQE